MKKSLLLCLLAFMAVFFANAQRLRFNISVSPDTVVEGLKMYVAPLDIADEGRTVPLRLKDGAFTGGVPSSDSNFYQIIAAYNGIQMITPFYVEEGGSVSFEARILGSDLLVENSADNKALSCVNSIFRVGDRTLWMEPGLSPERMESIIAGYISVADSLSAIPGLTPAVCDYMKVYAYIRASSAYDFLSRAQNITQESIPFKKEDILPSMTEVLDNDIAAVFPQASQMIAEQLPAKASLAEKMAALYSGCNNEPLRAKVAALIVERFLSKHDYSTDFNGGLAMLERVCNEYGLSQEYVADYEKRRSTIVGAEFPSEVVLVDAQGNVVPFSNFRGKYVYIDMWASWCGPCCREVPYLKELEASLVNKDVVFVSISTDADTDSWKSKMSELGMHGNQLHDRDNALGTALNVKGIPFFVIYDKEGRLHTYGAMRPSKGEVLKVMLESLK